MRIRNPLAKFNNTAVMDGRLEGGEEFSAGQWHSFNIIVDVSGVRIQTALQNTEKLILGYDRYTKEIGVGVPWGRAFQTV